MAALKVLVLEDDPERRKLFMRAFFKEGNFLVMVDSILSCVSNLESEEWDLLFLDHDLGGQAYCPSDNNSGYAVAEWLAANPQHMPRKVYLHSMNGAGSDNMKRALPDAIQCPFSLIIQALIEESRKP